MENGRRSAAAPKHSTSGRRAGQEVPPGPATSGRLRDSRPRITGPRARLRSPGARRESRARRPSRAVPVQSRACGRRRSATVGGFPTPVRCPAIGTPAIESPRTQPVRRALLDACAGGRSRQTAAEKAALVLEHPGCGSRADPLLRPAASRQLPHPPFRALACGRGAGRCCWGMTHYATRAPPAQVGCIGFLVEAASCPAVPLTLRTPHRGRE